MVGVKNIQKYMFGDLEGWAGGRGLKFNFFSRANKYIINS
jgi:hypothetical protein